MCDFCSNQKHIKQPKFRLFDINPIPFNAPLRPQKDSNDSSRPQKPTNDSSRPQKPTNDSSRPQKPTNDSSRPQKDSTVLLKLPKCKTFLEQSQKFKVKQKNEQISFNTNGCLKICTMQNITNQKIFYSSKETLNQQVHELQEACKEHTLIFEKLQNHILEIKKSSSNNNIIAKIKELVPSSKISKIYISGTAIPVNTLIDFQENTNIAKFISPEGNILMINCKQIHVIEILNINDSL